MKKGTKKWLTAALAAAAAILAVAAPEVVPVIPVLQSVLLGEP